MLCISISSAEGSAIKTAGDFAAMTADGDYYLDADISIDTTYETAFTGTFDGNGHTVTLTAPMFAQFDGTVRDLNIEGIELSGNKNLAAFALYTSKGITAINVVNTVNIRVTGISDDKTSGLIAGGILADSNMASINIFKSCVNYGNITVETAVVSDETKGTNYGTFVGGIVGRADTLNIKFSENHGDITALSNTSMVGGIVGRAAYVAFYSLCDIVDCTNTGNIVSGQDAGGMAGYIGVSANDIYVPYTIKNCDNSGNIAGGYRAGGFVGYCYSSGATTKYYLEITSSITTGNVKAGRPNFDLAGNEQYAFASLFVGYANSVNNKIQGCLAIGELSAITGDNYVTPFYVIMGCSSAITALCPISENYLCDNNTTEWYTYATAEANVAQCITISDAISNNMLTRCTYDELKSGSILTKLNEAAGASIFVQNLATDDYPKFDSALREQNATADLVEFEETTVVSETTTVAPDITTAPVVITTTAAPTTTVVPSTTTPVTTNTDDTTKTSGCGKSATIFNSIMIISILGSAVIIIKKH